MLVINRLSDYFSKANLATNAQKVNALAQRGSLGDE